MLVCWQKWEISMLIAPEYRRHSFVRQDYKDHSDSYQEEMLYKKTDESKWIELVVLQPVTVVEIPNGALLQLGPIEVTARVATGNMTLELNIKLPSSNSSLEPYVESYDGYISRPHGYKEYYAWNFCIDRFFGCLMFGLLSLIIFNEQRQLRSLRRWTRSVESLRKVRREPIEIVPI
ncbi:unnamed protein product [Cylicocyclus nassatus]|uniref:Uncharacterized protein n=1 Tax=Cylicocyclus nassatus TaxID=53992 RepID=A0AA36H8C5_CYLNA|nr:unnamed protein product [Cylicocyclus nassatus]